MRANLPVKMTANAENAIGWKKNPEGAQTWRGLTS
jgi:hypothetical protein